MINKAKKRIIELRKILNNSNDNKKDYNIPNFWNDTNVVSTGTIWVIPYDFYIRKLDELLEYFDNNKIEDKKTVIGLKHPLYIIFFRAYLQHGITIKKVLVKVIH